MLEVKKPQDLEDGLFMDFPSYPTRSLTTEENAELLKTIDFFGLQKETSDLQISLGKGFKKQLQTCGKNDFLGGVVSLIEMSFSVEVSLFNTVKTEINFLFKIQRNSI